MPLSAAEKQRQYRERLKSRLGDAVLEKERARCCKRKAERKIKTIHDLTPREQRAKREMWKKQYLKRATMIGNGVVFFLLFYSYNGNAVVIFLFVFYFTNTIFYTI